MLSLAFLCAPPFSEGVGTGRRGRGAGAFADRVRAVGPFAEHYHGERNRQGLENRIIEPDFESAGEGEVNCRERLGGLLRYYHRDAA